MQIQSWLGVRNTSPARSIPDNALSDASDIDIDDAGIITRRNGSSLSQSISNITAAYSTLGGDAYVVAGGNLLWVQENSPAQTICPSTATSFAEFEDVVFTNDGLRIEKDLFWNLNVPAPINTPEISITTGDMEPGRYSIMNCYQSLDSGIEGGTSPIVTVEIPSGKALVINNLPAIAGYRTRTYITDQGGTVYYNESGVPLNNMQALAEPFPEGAEQIAYYEGRLYLSKEIDNESSIVWFSQPFHYHLYNVAGDYFIVKGIVRMMVGVTSGLLIGTDSGIYLYTGQNSSIQKIAPYGVVKGKSCIKKDNDTALLLSERGMCSFPPFKNMTEGKYSFATGKQCSVSLLEKDGIVRFVALTDGSGEPYNARS